MTISAGTRSPEVTWIRSPLTTSVVWMFCFTPSRITTAKLGTSFLNEFMMSEDLRSCQYAKVLLMVTTSSRAMPRYNCSKEPTNREFYSTLCAVLNSIPVVHFNQRTPNMNSECNSTYALLILSLLDDGHWTHLLVMRSPTQENIRPLLTKRFLRCHGQCPRAEWWDTAVRKPWSRAPCQSTVECWSPWTCGAKTWPAPSPSSVASTHWVRPSVAFCWLRSSTVPLIIFLKK